MIKRYNITVNGEQFEVEVEELGVSTPAKTPPSTTQTSSTQVKPIQTAPIKPAQVPKSPQGGSDSVVAPMPGVICDIRVSIGDSVKRGDVLLTLEAMKMENEIVAPKDGVVKTLNVEKGASVVLGDVLVTLG